MQISKGDAEVLRILTCLLLMLACSPKANPSPLVMDGGIFMAHGVGSFEFSGDGSDVGDIPLSHGQVFRFLVDFDLKKGVDNPCPLTGEAKCWVGLTLRVNGKEQKFFPEDQVFRIRQRETVSIPGRIPADGPTSSIITLTIRTKDSVLFKTTFNIVVAP